MICQFVLCSPERKYRVEMRCCCYDNRLSCQSFQDSVLIIVSKQWFLHTYLSRCWVVFPFIPINKISFFLFRTFNRRKTNQRQIFLSFTPWWIYALVGRRPMETEPPLDRYKSSFFFSFFLTSVQFFESGPQVTTYFWFSFNPLVVVQKFRQVSLPQSSKLSLSSGFV